MAQTILLQLDGREYRFNSGDVTATDAKEFRAQVGIPLMRCFRDDLELDIDVLAGIVWLVRRRSEPGLTFAAVAGSITYDSDIAPIDVVNGSEIVANTAEIGASGPET